MLRYLVFLNGLLLFCSVMLSLLFCCLKKQSKRKGEGWSNANNLELPQPPQTSSFIAGRSNAALLFSIFGGFRCSLCCVLLFLLDIKLENR